MKIIKLTGGLGNQMFQYAYGRSRELRGKKIVFDTSFFHGHKAARDTAREFQLDKFNLETQAEFSARRHPGRDFWRRAGRRLKIAGDGYWQNEKYFADFGDALRREFTLRASWSAAARAMVEKITGCEAVSVHLRRGDYVTDPQTRAYHGVCAPDYYDQAIKIMKKRLSAPTFFIFSDDPEYVRKNFSGPEFILVSAPGISDPEDLLLMSSCRHHIIANSSFSWWGAWLNPQPGKIVVAPEKWFNNKNAEIILPVSWLKI